MERVAITERPKWREQAESLGFQFHTFDGEPYWDETAYYRFSLQQVENDLEGPTEELHEMCMDLVSRAVKDERILQRLCIPESFWDFIRTSYLRGDPHLYGRMDFAYDGKSPAKLLELNYDTPTSLYESAFYQWIWLEQNIELGVLRSNADQFNSLQEKLVQAFEFISPQVSGVMHFASVRESPEDRGTVGYLEDIARQAGISTRYVSIEDVGISRKGQYTDLNNEIIQSIFKLYPWEFMFHEEYAKYLATASTTWFEPPWKAVLSNKGALPLLWELHTGHPNLLEAHFENAQTPALSAGWVRKPFFSREGANVELISADGKSLKVDGPYSDSPYIRQAFHSLPKFGDNYALIGSWVIGDCAAGIGIREDSSLITKDTSRFIPHIIDV